MFLLYLFVFSLAEGAPISVHIGVGDRHVQAEFPVGFASVTMDFHPASAGPNWGMNASILEVDLDNPALRTYASALAPAILRLGGSEAGSMVIYTDFPKDNVSCPDKFYYCLSRARWDKILKFAQETGVRLMLDLNIIGPNKANNSWDAQLSNIESLFAYTASSGMHVVAWEIGNENQNDLKPSDAAQRVTRVREGLNAAWPEPERRPLLIGPSVHIHTDWIIDFLHDIRDGVVSVFSYHLYPGFGLAPDVIKQMPTPAFLDDSNQLVQSATWAARSVKPTVPLMVTETAAAWASGVSGGTNAFFSDFWYFDQLAHAAENGHFAFARQTIIGGNYSLIDQNNNFRANPDFFIAKLWRQLIEGDFQSGRVLHCTRKPDMQDSIHRELRYHAFCGAGNALLLGIVNTGSADLGFRVSFDDGMVAVTGKREEYVLQALKGDETHLSSRSVTLNGHLIEAVLGHIPQLLPRLVDGSSPLQAPAESVSFIRFSEVLPKACTQRPAATRVSTPLVV